MSGIGNYPGVSGIGNYPGVSGIGNYPGVGGGHYPGNIGSLGPISGHTGPNHGINSGGKLPVLVGPGAFSD